MLKWCSRSIFLQVVLGLALGIACGLSFPDLSLQLKPLGDGFIKLIKMLIGLIVFCVVVSGISGAGDLKKVGRIGLKSVIYFEVLTTLALVIGLVFASPVALAAVPIFTWINCPPPMPTAWPSAASTSMAPRRSSWT